MSANLRARTVVGLVSQETGTAYGVWFPDLPGCFSAADTLEDLRMNASEAVALWVEDDGLPSIRSLDELRSDPDVEAGLAEGAFLLAVPIISLAGRTVKANITLDAGLLKALDATAKARGLTRSALIADMARREIAEG